jgi:hypothetical protein
MKKALIAAALALPAMLDATLHAQTFDVASVKQNKSGQDNEEQLGLKLESNRGPIDVLVIDHVEKPTDD